MLPPDFFLIFSARVFGFLVGFFGFFGFLSIFLSIWTKQTLRENTRFFSSAGNGKNTFLFFSCRERHGRAYRKRKNRVLFLPSTRGTVSLPREARFCFRDRRGFASTRSTAMSLINGKHVFFFPLPREARFTSRGVRICFHERHGHASSEKKKNVLPVLSFGLFYRE